MRRRPEPNPRRGILRAAAAVIVLIILLIVVVIVVSSLTAPTVKAPTVPPTPGPVSRTPVSLTPKAHASTTPTARHTARPTATPGKKSKHKLAALLIPAPQPGMAERSAGPAIVQPARFQATKHLSPAASRFGGWIAYFEATEGLDRPSAKLLVTGPRETRVVATADPYVRPIWSAHGRHLLYVTVRQTDGIPGAHWTLMEWNRRGSQRVQLAETDALGLVPLGWSRDRILYLVARSAATTLYSVTRRGSSPMSIILSQPLVNASLSPGGSYVALAAPANCDYCTVDIFRVNGLTTWVGPTGMPNATTMAWAADDRTLIARMGNRLVAIDAAFDRYRNVSPVHGLPNRWGHRMRATLYGQDVTLTDTVTGRTYGSNGT